MFLGEIIVNKNKEDKKPTTSLLSFLNKTPPIPGTNTIKLILQKLSLWLDFDAFLRAK